MNVKPEVATKTWSDVYKHYKKSVVETNFDYEPIFCIIEYVVRSKLDEKLYAATSHDMLLVSQENRYDVDADSVRIECRPEDATINIEFLEKGKIGSNTNEFEVKLTDDYVSIFSELVKRLFL